MPPPLLDCAGTPPDNPAQEYTPEGPQARALRLQSAPMANSLQAAKRARQAVGRRAANMSARSKLRTAISKAVRALDSGDAEQAATAYREARPVIDSMAGKGIIHPNKAARHKSRLNKHLKALSAE